MYAKNALSTPSPNSTHSAPLAPPYRFGHLDPRTFAVRHLCPRPKPGARRCFRAGYGPIGPIWQWKTLYRCKMVTQKRRVSLEYLGVTQAWADSETIEGKGQRSGHLLSLLTSESDSRTAALYNIWNGGNWLHGMS